MEFQWNEWLTAVILWLIMKHGETVAPINPATLSFCAGKSDFCWDGFTCFKTSEACTNGGCGRCDDWSNDQNYGAYCYFFDDFVGKAGFPGLPPGTTFTSSSPPIYGSGPNAGKQYATFRYLESDWWCWSGYTRSPPVNVQVNCPAGYFPEVEFVNCSDPNLDYWWRNNADCCDSTCYFYRATDDRYCKMCGLWSGMPDCEPGCSPALLNNGDVIYNGLFKNNVYRQNTTATFSCNDGFCLSTNSSTADGICIAENRTGNWSLLPTCVVGCPVLSLPFGSVSYVPDTLSFTGSCLLQGTQAIFNCSIGYYLTPPTYIYTCVIPNWDLGGIVPTCQIGCSTIISLTNGQPVLYSPSTLDSGVYRNGTVATFACAAGYYLSTMTNSTTTDCNDVGQWTSLPTCISGCSLMGSLTNGGSISYSNPTVNDVYPVSTVVTFFCPSGYYLIPSATSSTCIGPTWSSSLPICHPGCPPVTLMNGVVSYTPVLTFNGVYKNATVATFTCSSGYYLSTLTQSSTTNCNSTGQWISVPTCKRGCSSSDSSLQWPSLNTVTFVTAGIVNSLYQPGDTASFTCLATYYLSSSNPGICNDTGLWSNLPTCLAGCVALSNNMIATYNRSASAFDPQLFEQNTAASISCQKGYYLAGSSAATCVGGIWTPQPTCSIGCANITTPNLILSYSSNSVINNVFINGSNVSFSCDVSYSLMGTLTASCVNGNWDNTPTCRIDCMTGKFPSSLTWLDESEKWCGF